MGWKPEYGEIPMDLKNLGFVMRDSSGIVGCGTIPCAQGKMPDERMPDAPCAIIHSFCDQSPREQMTPPASAGDESRGTGDD